MEISVIIPVYNTEQYLEECLDSVIAQEFKDWECLIIDDGSTDSSGNICDSYAGKERRFKVFHTANSGVSAARNLGIRHASGKYIAFIDSDDTVEREYLSGLYGAMVKNKADLAVCGLKLVRPSGTDINNVAQNNIVIGSEDMDAFVELNQKFLLYAPYVKLYHSSIIKQYNIQFPIGTHYGEDLTFNFEYLEYVSSISVIDSPSYNYRILSEGSLSTSASSRNFGNNYKQWKIIRDFFEKKRINSQGARMYLSNRLWGNVYDLIMSDKLSVKEIKYIFSIEFLEQLKTFNKHTIAIPTWLEIIISKRLYRLIWLIQRRPQ